MKKRLPLFLLIILLILFFLPINANAYSRHSGLFVSSDYSDAYHVLFCRDVPKIGNHRTYYNSTEDAEADGNRPCMHCGKYVRIIRGDYTGTTTERDIIDAYLEGFYAGENFGKDEGYQNGKVDGYDKGYDDAQDHYKSEIEALNKTHEKELEKSQSKIPWGWILSSAVIAFLIGANITANKKEIEINKLKDQHEAMKVVEIIAAESGTTASELLDRVYINYRALDGIPEETAESELRNKKIIINSRR